MSNLFGEKLRKLREVRGLSKAELARRMGYASNSYIYDIERGGFVPPPEKLRVLARALEVPPTLLEEVALEAKVEALGIREPEFIAMFKDYPRLSQKDKRAIIAAYLSAKRSHGSSHR